MDIRHDRLTSCSVVHDLRPSAGLPGRRAPRLAATALLAVTPATLLAGCGGGDPTPQATVTRTVMVPSTTSPTTAAEEQGGDVDDRSFDVGTVVGSRKRPDDTLVLSLDRWTVQGVDDATLARQGIEVVPHAGDRYTNQNQEKTYDVPVAADVQVVFNECVPPSAPGAAPGLRSRPGTIEDFLRMPGRDSEVVLLAYTDGELTRLDTDPRC